MKFTEDGVIVYEFFEIRQPAEVKSMESKTDELNQ